MLHRLIQQKRKLMNILTDTLKVNRDALKKTLLKLRHIPLLALAYVVYQLILFAVSMIGANLGAGIGFLWGFVNYLVNIAIMAHFLSLLYNVIRYNRLTPQDLINRQFTRLMPSLLQAFFFLYIIELLFSLFLSPILPSISSFFILLVWEALKTPVQESVYLGNQYGTGALRATFEFWKSNWAQWSLIILAAAVYQILIQPFVGRLTLLSIWLLPVVWLVSGVLISVWMVWRGELFDVLDSSSMRSREFRRGFD